VRRRALAPAALAWLAGCETTVLPPVTPTPPPTPAAPQPPLLPAAELPPPAPREFRGVWVATVNNIDWPSQSGLPAEVMRSEALAILERARALGLNAIVLQVRPAGDAIFPSTLEPWTEYLAGEQGRAPWARADAPWDPLAFWVQEAHRRGLELHAWFNPYRARHSSAKSPLVAPHIGVRQPAVVKRYGDMLWMDPGEPAAAAQTLAVVADVLRRYDVDAVHIDDYFYPYPVAVNGADLPFPDDEAWARYQLGGGTLMRDDWRRAQVDSFVQALQRTVREVKPAVRFGISPFGLPRPELRPPGVTGFSQYHRLYADAERWLEKGWLDYWAPQLYWPIAREGQAFPVLLDYWLAANPQQRHVWPGLFTSQVKAAANPWPAREIAEQIELQRARPAATGHIHFSMAALMADREGLAPLLQKGSYTQAALVPATPWLQAPPVEAPALKAEGARVRIQPAAGEAARRWAVWRRVGGAWRFAVLPAAERVFDASGADAVVVQAVDRIGRLGTSAIIRLP
jgi:uncharacterized lipoprotein YddW (UPF0748 family)